MKLFSVTSSQGTRAYVYAVNLKNTKCPYTVFKALVDLTHQIVEIQRVDHLGRLQARSTAATDIKKQCWRGRGTSST